MSTTINHGDENLLRTFKESLNRQMLKEAEPLVQAAIKGIEVAMRERLAACLIAQIESSVSFERMGNDLRITIRRDGK